MQGRPLFFDLADMRQTSEPDPLDSPTTRPAVVSCNLPGMAKKHPASAVAESAGRLQLGIALDDIAVVSRSRGSSLEGARHDA